ncbi:tetratricopeptide repeat protein, partial [Elusimicrobiota bacterium]
LKEKVLNEKLINNAFACTHPNDEAPDDHLLSLIENAQSYRKQGKFDMAENNLKTALDIDPENDIIYTELGLTYSETGEHDEAARLFKRALRINPENTRALFKLAWIHKSDKDYHAAIILYNKLAELKPNQSVYFNLGQCYLYLGKNDDAIQAINTAININRKNDRIYRALGMFYKKLGKTALADEYMQKASEILQELYNPTTRDNYVRLAEILIDRKIECVCSGYPMRSIEPLKKMLKSFSNNVIYVDNELIFKNAVARDGYDMYFTDMFGGDFGHCTRQGNSILAENIADVILKEIINKL